jgi:hypothetical protein
MQKMIPVEMFSELEEGWIKRSAGGVNSSMI